MNTTEFNQNYEINRQSKGVSAVPKALEYRPPQPAYTADGEIYDANEEYFYFDSASVRVRRSKGMPRVGEHLCAHGVKIVAVAKLYAACDDAITAAQNFLRLETERNEKRIEKFEAAKTGTRRPLKNFSLVNRNES